VVVNFILTEQQFAQIEKQLISCNSKLDTELKKSENLAKDLEQSGEYLIKIILISVFLLFL